MEVDGYLSSELADCLSFSIYQKTPLIERNICPVIKLAALETGNGNTASTFLDLRTLSNRNINQDQAKGFTIHQNTSFGFTTLRAIVQPVVAI